MAYQLFYNLNRIWSNSQVTKKLFQLSKKDRDRYIFNSKFLSNLAVIAKAKAQSQA